MALINTAGILAGRGFRVLVIDFDLEAPGLSYLASQAVDNAAPINSSQISLQPGFVDLITDAKTRGPESDLFALDVGKLVELYTRKYKLPEDLREFKDGSLRIMPAGKFDEGYAQRFDALNLRELYEEGVGEPLIRAFKKKIAEAGIFDYVLIDSRTGFSDEAGICTRDLPDHLMILSGLNRQNVEGTSEFLHALRTTTNGKARFQIILSPVPNGEDTLLDERESAAKKFFEIAWGAKVDLSLQIPYHPQLALTEEPHIFRRRRGYLFEAYRTIEKSMLKAIGHDSSSLAKRVEEAIAKKDYVGALQELHHLIRLDGGRLALFNIVFRLGSGLQNQLRAQSGTQPNQEISVAAEILSNEDGKRVVQFLIDHMPLAENPWPAKGMLAWLTEYPDLTDRLHKRVVEALPKDADTLGNYAVFLYMQRKDKDAEVSFKRAVEAEPKAAGHFSNYFNFLFRRGEFDRIKELCDQAMKKEPQSPTVLGCYAFFLQHYRRDIDGAERFYKKAIELAPKDALWLPTYATLIANDRGNLDDAENLFKRAIDLNPRSDYCLRSYGAFLAIFSRDKRRAEEVSKKALDVNPRNADNLGHYALLLGWSQENDSEAEALFKRSIEADRRSFSNFNNYGQFLVGIGKIEEGQQILMSCQKDSPPPLASDAAELYFSLWLATRLQKIDASEWEQAFKFQIERGFRRLPWNFDRMLKQAEGILGQDELVYAKVLAAAFLDEKKVTELERYERWRKLEPLDPNTISKSGSAVAI